MKRLLPIVCFIYMSCSTGKLPVSGRCFDKKITSSYNRISDSTFSLGVKELGRTYFNFSIDSCIKTANSEFNLAGYISFLDGNDRKMPGVDIIQVNQIDKRTLKYFKYLGKTDEWGNFNIKIGVVKREVYILLDKQNFTYTAVSLSLSPD